MPPAMDWFVLCSVHDTHNIFRYHLFSNSLMPFSMFFSGTTFHVHVAVENMHVHIMCCLVLLFVAFHSFYVFMIF